jgi:hypothetical protein
LVRHTIPSHYPVLGLTLPLSRQDFVEPASILECSPGPHSPLETDIPVLPQQP